MLVKSRVTQLWVEKEKTEELGQGMVGKVKEVGDLDLEDEVDLVETKMEKGEVVRVVGTTVVGRMEQEDEVVRGLEAEVDSAGADWVKEEMVTEVGVMVKDEVEKGQGVAEV